MVEMPFARVQQMRDALDMIRQTHRPHKADARLCAEGCSGDWPCTTRLEADHALGHDSPESR